MLDFRAISDSFALLLFSNTGIAYPHKIRIIAPRGNGKRLKISEPRK